MSKRKKDCLEKIEIEIKNMDEEKKDDDIIDFPEQKENDLKEEENYEFLIPISNDNKLKTFVDRYFLKYYLIYSKEAKLYQYAFLHTNKYNFF